MNNSEKLFTGKKVKWLPLFRRFVARLARQSSVAPQSKGGKIHLGKFAVVRVVSDGLEIGLVLTKALPGAKRLKTCTRSPKRVTHAVTVSGPDEIDAELMSWIKTAEQRARSAKRRST